MKKVFFGSFLLLIFAGSSVYSQIGVGNGAGSMNRNDNEEIVNEFFKGIKKNEESNSIKGSPYLNEDFQIAMLDFPNYDPISAEVRYNIAKEEMQVKIDEDGYRVLHPGVVVKMNNRPFKMLAYRGEKKNLDLLGYFEFLTPDNGEGDLVLLNKHSITVRRGKAAAAMQKATPPKYISKDDLYLKFGASKPVMVERKTKKFLKQFPADHRNQVKGFMEENKLRSKDIADLKAIVNYYNANF